MYRSVSDTGKLLKRNPSAPNAPINVKPHGRGGGADPGEFDIFMEARVKFPTPRHLLNVKIPPHQGSEKDSLKVKS